MVELVETRGPAVSTGSTAGLSSSTVPGTSGSTSTAVLASCSSARISPEYDVRRQSVSSVRMKRRTSSGPGDARASSAGAAPGVAVSSASAPASCQAVSAASASKSVGTGTRSGTVASPLRPAEQQPAEAGVGGVLAGPPPGHDLRLGTRQRDVGEPQLLAGVLGPRPPGGLGRPGEVEPPGAGLVVVEQLGRLGDVAVEEVREVDDGVLQSLAAVDGEDLYGGRVGVEPAGALGRGEGLATLRPEPLEQGGQPEPLPTRGLVEQLAEVVEVGHQPFAVGARQHPARQAGGRDRLVHRGHAAGAEQVEPAPDPLADPVGERVTSGVEGLRGLADERGQRHGPHPGGALLLQRLEQREPLVGRLAQHHAAATAHHRRDPVGEQRGPDRLDPLDAGEEQRDVAGADRLPVVRRAGAEQPRHVGGEVLGDVLPQLVDPDRAVAAGREVGRPELTQAQGCADRCADQPALPVVRLDVEHRDLRVAELGAAGQGLERADQAGVTAPVGGEGVPGGGGAGSAEVGDHVAAAEGVDRLLRVADQDQRGAAR